MSKVNLLSKEWCDIVFEGKNKNYGAYKLREEAGQRYRNALLLVFLVVFILCSSFFFWDVFSQKYLKSVQVEMLSKLRMPEAQMGHVLRAVAEPYKYSNLKKSIIKSGAPKIVKNEEVKESTLGNTDRMIDEALNVLKNEGFTTTEVEPVEDDLKNLREVVNPPLTPVEVVEQMPVFPGGVRSLMKWLDAHITYPIIYSRNKIEGIVNVSFIVGIDGTIKDIKVTKSSSSRLAFLVSDAVRRMPKWTPGSNEGKPTPVRITLPVKFGAN